MRFAIYGTVTLILGVVGYLSLWPFTQNLQGQAPSQCPSTTTPCGNLCCPSGASCVGGACMYMGGPGGGAPGGPGGGGCTPGVPDCMVCRTEHQSCGGTCCYLINGQPQYGTAACCDGLSCVMGAECMSAEGGSSSGGNASSGGSNSSAQACNSDSDCPVFVGGVCTGPIDQEECGGDPVTCISAGSCYIRNRKCHDNACGVTFFTCACPRLPLKCISGVR